MFGWNKRVGETIMQSLLVTIFLVFSFSTIFPFWNVAVKSFTPGTIAMVKQITFLPESPTLENYRVIFSDSLLLQALWISVLRTVIGTVISVTTLSLSAYAVTKKFLKGRRIILLFLLIPMYFSAGMIPSYVNIVHLHLTNNFLVYILPGMFGGFNCLLIMSYISQLPASLEESAFIDGANYLQIFFRIIVPLSTPVLATITLFCAVGQWNAWFDAQLYVNRSTLLPLQLVLQNIIKTNSFEYLAQKARDGDLSALTRVKSFTATSISMATMIFTILPILLVYPFLQKYFVKGIMLGGIKG